MAVLLYNRSCYTLLNSTNKVSDIVEFAKNNNYQSIALIDTNVLYGCLEFYHKAKENGIKPIFGLEITVEIQQEYYSFLIYAKNDDGYLELIKISSYLKCENPFLTIDQFNNISNNILKIYNFNNGYLTHLITINDLATLDNIFQNINNDTFVAVGANNNQFNINANNILLTLCHKYNIKPIAINLSLYKDETYFEAYKTLCAINQNKTIDDNTLVYNTNAHLLTLNELNKLFDKESLLNTDLLADICNVNMQIKKASLPKFNTGSNVSSAQYLTSLTQTGLIKRFNSNKVPKIYSDRLKKELDVIIKMHFEDYFLIVFDLIRYAKNNDIYIGPGRGSAVGCLVAYCLGITHIDPVKNELFFERFLNEERVSMPDIDLDFADEDREKIIRYTVNKYGYDCTSHILTFTSLACKQVIKDVGKALNIYSNNIDLILKNVIDNPKITLMACYNNSNGFKTAINSNDINRKLFDISLKLEGLPKNVSTHASGIIISNDSLNRTIPTIKLNQDIYTTGYTMEYLEDLGLIKLDYLGLKNLSIIKNISNEIKKSNPNFDILKIDINDINTYQLISSANTVGIFQLESDGMKELIRKLKPNCFNDLAILIALYRPGPMENIPTFIQNRNNPESIKYINEDLKIILKNTSGVMVYQEQIMQIASTIAGFSLNKADILRKAISKKKASELDELKEDFIKGGINNGYDRSIVSNIYDMIYKFANYGFNKSHSYGYALLAYQLAYLKANYPLYFYKEILNNCIGNINKTNEYIIEARNNNINILPVDINKSYEEYYIENDALRFPFTCIKGIGSVCALEIIKERKNREFINYYDFVARCQKMKITESNIESLIKANACNSFNLSIHTMLNNYDAINRYATLCKIEKDDNISFDFDLISKPILIVQNDSKQDISKYEFESLGFYLSGHPVIKYRNNYPNALTSKQLINYSGKCSCILLVQTIKEHRTKNGDLMSFVNGYDEYGNINIVLMPDAYNKYHQSLKKGDIIFIEGIMDTRNSIKVYTLQMLEG